MYTSKTMRQILLYRCKNNVLAGMFVKRCSTDAKLQFGMTVKKIQMQNNILTYLVSYVVQMQNDILARTEKLTSFE